MSGRDELFFSAHEGWFEEAYSRHGKGEAISMMRSVLEKRLKVAYDAMEPVKGDPEEFVRVVGTRDSAVKLKVSFPEFGPDRIVYRFHTDPFRELKRLGIDPLEIDEAYMPFKVSYLLGEGWSYKTTSHLWWGDPFTEHVISRER